MPQIDVVTQHNDNGRTGANLHETVLNTNNVNPQHFGKLFSYPVQGHVYAQPLYASNVTIPNKGIRNVVYIATMHNTVYAFDAEDRNQTATPFWQKQLEDSIPLPDPNIGFPNYRDILREVGILSTPVISRAHAPNAIYVVTASKDPHGNGPGAFSHHLHALDLTTGTDIRPPVQIQATIAGSNGQITFTSNWQNQRPALLLANDTIYIAFASYGDQGPYHGWLLAYSASTLMQISKFNTTLTGGKAGIWQAGQGPAADDAGNLYCFIGNGSFNGNRQNPPTDLGDSIIRLRPDLTFADWFSPMNNQELNNTDYDLGSSGPLLLPGTNLFVGGGKDGKFYLLDRKQLGHLGLNIQDFYVSLPDDPNDPLPPQDPPIHTHHIHGGPVYWNGPNGAWVYIWPENDVLKAFEFLPDRTFDTEPTPTPIRGFSNPQQGLPRSTANERSPGMPGGMLSLSANGNTAGTGILWASHPLADAAHETVPGILHAYDASDLSRDLWNSHMNANRDCIGSFAKFCPPTIANGRVYMATFSDSVVVYGPL